MLLFVALALTPGCVRRRLFVNTNPPGALVYVDNQHIGTTPCAVDFTYYGTREVRLVKPGYKTLTVNRPIPTPWYQFPPLDFVSENMVPSKIQDNRSVTYNLSPQVMVPTGELVDRGSQLRQETAAAMAAAAVPAPTGSSPSLPMIPAPPASPTPPEASPFSLPPPSFNPGPPVVSPPLR
jgi:hypothetical protein